MPRFTPVEANILSKLGDGKTHSAEELLECLDDDLAQSGSIRTYIYELRKKLQSVGKEIISEKLGKDRPVRYRLITLVLEDEE